MTYERYVMVLKWTTLSPLCLRGRRFFPPAFPGGRRYSERWSRELRGASEFFTTLLAIFGTTISPYLFFWQASQEAEDQRVNRDEKSFKKKHPATGACSFGTYPR